MIPIADRGLVAALFDRLVPEDDYPSVTQTGVMAALDCHAGADHLALWAEMLTPGFEQLAVETSVRFNRSFAELADTDKDCVIADLEAGTVQTGWPVPPQDFLRAAVSLAVEHYYGALDAPAWQMVGYDAAAKRASGVDGDPHVVPNSGPFSAIGDSYDVIVIGAGAGGGVVAALAAESGARVLLVDRGRSEAFVNMPRDHVRNHRLPLHGQNTSPSDPGPRVYMDVKGHEHVVPHSHQAFWHNTAMTVGGGTRVYQGMAWRFLPLDFRLASAYGVPPGSSLSDWPIGYDEMEPWYSRAEWELGVCGDGAVHRVQGYRSRPYPMQPLPGNAEAAVLQRGAAKLGLSTGPVPLLINSVPRDGRGRCVQCGECVGFPCPSDAKNGTHNVMIPRALATGRAVLVEQCRATRITSDRNGIVTGVDLVDCVSGGRKLVAAGQVVVACGAIESARLLLASRSENHPTGLGNRTDQVGRHLHGHRYVSAYGLFDDALMDSRGPGVSIATCDLYESAEFGGGVLANECIKLPILFWYWALPPELRRWGLANKQAMRAMYRRTSHIFGPPQEVPHANSRVTLDPHVRDAHGVPVARLQGALHPESIAAAERLRVNAMEWMAASGASRVWTRPISPELSAGAHQAGTCRMGNDPVSSVTDPFGRVHGHSNLWVLDGSLHVTNGGFNPVLTIFALAFRGADAMISGKAA